MNGADFKQRLDSADTLAKLSDLATQPMTDKQVQAFMKKCASIQARAHPSGPPPPCRTSFHSPAE